MERRTESRLSVELPGSYRMEGWDIRAMFFSQISSKGCRLTAENVELDIGDEIELFLGPVGPISANVRWVARNAAGVEFDTAVDAEVVGYFAAFINDVA